MSSLENPTLMIHVVQFSGQNGHLGLESEQFVLLCKNFFLSCKTSFLRNCFCNEAPLPSPVLYSFYLLVFPFS